MIVGAERLILFNGTDFVQVFTRLLNAAPEEWKSLKHQKEDPQQWYHNARPSCDGFSVRNRSRETWKRN
jgi:hypothetical protein